jgi:hypothetical protein
MAVRGFPHLHVGDVADVPAGEAMVLLSLGGAEPAPDEAKVAAAEIQTREPEVESRDPVLRPAKRVKGKLP